MFENKEHEAYECDDFVDDFRDEFEDDFEEEENQSKLKEFLFSDAVVGGLSATAVLLALVAAIVVSILVIFKGAKAISATFKQIVS